MDGIGSDNTLKSLEGILTPPVKPNPLKDGPGSLLNNFGDMLKQHMDNLNELDEKAESLIQDYAVGKPVELHQVMLAEEISDTAMQLTAQFRNKALSAYQEVMRTQI